MLNGCKVTIIQVINKIFQMFFLHIINNEVINKTIKQTPIIKLEHIHNHLKSDLSLNAVFVIRFTSHFVYCCIQVFCRPPYKKFV